MKLVKARVTYIPSKQWLNKIIANGETFVRNIPRVVKWKESVLETLSNDRSFKVEYISESSILNNNLKVVEETTVEETTVEETTVEETTVEETTVEEVNIDAMKKDELIAYAKNIGVEVPEKVTVAELKELIAAKNN